MRCPNCHAENPASAQRCQQCDASLVAMQLRQTLNRAQSEIKRGEYAAARTQLAIVKAGVSDLAVSADSTLLTARWRWLDALICYYQGMFTPARDALLPVLATLEPKTSDKQLLGEILNTLGNIEYGSGNASVATRYYQRALSLAEQTGSGELAARLWSNLGNVSNTEGRMHEALFRYNKAAQYAEAHGDPTTLLISYRLLCHVYIQIGPLSRGMHYAQRLIELLPQVENQNSVSQALVSAAVVYRCYGDFAQAAEYLQRALSLARRANNKIAEAYALARLSLVWQDLGDYHSSYTAASTVFSDQATPLELKKEAAARLAEYHTANGEFARARHYIDWLQRLDQQPGREDHERFYLTIARFYDAQGDWPLAEQNFQLAIAQSKQRGDAYELGREYHEYARAIAQRDGAITAAAGEMLTQAVAILRKVGASHNLMMVQQILSGGITTPPTAPPTPPLPSSVSD